MTKVGTRWSLVILIMVKQPTRSRFVVVPFLPLEMVQELYEFQEVRSSTICLKSSKWFVVARPNEPLEKIQDAD